MNIYLFWILFLALWATVPLMVIKGRADEAPKVKTSPVFFILINSLSISLEEKSQASS